MCLLGPDQNAGIRAQTKAADAKRKFDYRSRGLKFYNKETSYLKSKGVATIGLSRAKSDAYYAAIHTQGKGRQAAQDAFKKYAISQKGFEGGRSRQIRGGRDNDLLALLDKRSKIESTVNNTFGKNMAIAEQGIKRQYMNTMSKNRSSLGVIPSEFGPPTVMPPKQRANPFFQIASLGISAAGAGLFSSDIKLKENIVKKGKSPKGFQLYEFNYKDIPNRRYQGVMAQDLLKSLPSAVVKTDNGYLAVDYNQTDVEFKEV